MAGERKLPAVRKSNQRYARLIFGGTTVFVMK